MGVFVESASAVWAAVCGFDDEDVAGEDWGLVDAEVAREDYAFAFMVFDHYLCGA